MTNPDAVVINGDAFDIPDSAFLLYWFEDCKAAGLNPQWATGPKGYVRPDDTLDDRLAG